MMGAMVLSLLLAAVMGVAIPLLMQKLGRDPALGSSVMITPSPTAGDSSFSGAGDGVPC
jgi:magnesium transporter